MFRNMHAEIRGNSARLAATIMTLLSVVPALYCLLSTAQAQTAPTITIYVGTAPGGGYDLYGRLAARHLGRFLPGHPSIVTSNMPGAGEVKMANWLYNVAPADGTAIAVISSGAVYGGLFGNTAVQYDPSKFNWLGSLDSSTPVAVVWGQTGFKTARDLLTTPIVIGGAGAVSNLTVWPRLVNSLLGAQFKLVTGYVGSTGVSLAMENGEVQGMIGIEWDGLKLANREWLEDSKIRVLMQFDSQRIKDLPNVPTPLEFMKDEHARQVMLLFLESQQYGRAIAAPPGTSPEKVSIMRQAFAAMAIDPAFLADATKVHAEIDFTSGADVQNVTQQVYNTPKDTIARATQELQNAHP